MSLSQTTRKGRRRRFVSKSFELACLAATISSLIILGVLVVNIFSHGASWVDWGFISSFQSRVAEQSGIKAALVGSIWLIVLTGLIAVPVGVASAIYLEEICPPSRWRTIVEINISNLAGVPSIVYGVLGLGLFVRTMSLGRSLMAGALTLSLVVLPIVILASREALRAVPDSIRQASHALGATRWQTIWYQVLPASIPGIMSGVILALSRALGEAAPLIMIGAFSYLTFVPEGVGDPFTVLPLQIFNWSARPQPVFHELAAGGIIVLLVLLFCMNALAVWIRHRYGKRIRW